MSNPVYRGGDQSVVLFTPETAAYPWPAVSAGLAPDPGGTPIQVGYSNIPSKRRDRANKKGYGTGSPYALYNSRGVRSYMVGMNVKVGNIAFLQYCLRSSGLGGYKGLPDLCLYIGASDDTLDGGYMRRIRFAKCQQLILGFSEAAQEVTAEARFIGLYEDSSAVINPTLTQLKQFGDALTWENVMSITTGGGSGPEDLRAGFLSGLTATIDNHLEPKGIFPNYGDNSPRSNTHFAIRPGQPTVTVEPKFHSDLPASLVDSLINSQQWGDIQVLTTDAAPLTGTGITPLTMRTTFVNCLLGPDEQDGGESGSEITSSATLIADSCIIAAS